MMAIANDRILCYLWRVALPCSAMPKTRFIPKNLSARIVLQTIFAFALLLIPATHAIIKGTRDIAKEEVGQQVDQALDGIAYRIDNTLLTVEQTATMIQGDIPNHLDNPQELYKLCQSVLEANPSIQGCAIALNPDHYTSREKPFMAYMYRAHEEIVSTESFTSLPFTEQEWYGKELLRGWDRSKMRKQKRNLSFLTMSPSLWTIQLWVCWG